VEHDRRYGRYAHEDAYDDHYGDGGYADADYAAGGYADDSLDAGELAPVREPALRDPEPLNVRRVQARGLGVAPAPASGAGARVTSLSVGGGAAGLAVREPVAVAEPAPVPAPAPQPYRITTLHPRTYNEARTIGERFRDGMPVIMNLTEMDDADAKRLVDFAAGLSFGLRGSIERVTAKVFLLSPQNVDVTAEDKARIREGGFFNQS
jgi:cell division inhibitor SepF